MAGDVDHKQLRDLLRRRGVGKEAIAVLAKAQVGGAAFTELSDGALKKHGVSDPHQRAQLLRLSSSAKADFSKWVGAVPPQQKTAADALNEFYDRNGVSDKAGKGVSITDSFADNPKLLHDALLKKYPEKGDELKFLADWAKSHDDAQARQAQVAKQLEPILGKVDKANAGNSKGIVAAYCDSPAALQEMLAKKDKKIAKDLGFLEDWACEVDPAKKAAAEERKKKEEEKKAAEAEKKRKDEEKAAEKRRKEQEKEDEKRRKKEEEAAEQKKKEEERRRAEEEEREKKEEIERKAQEEAAAEEKRERKKRKEEERKRKAEADAKKKEEEEKAAEDARRKEEEEAEEARRKEEEEKRAEADRKAEKKRKRKEEKQRKEEEEARAKEEQEQQLREAEERAKAEEEAARLKAEEERRSREEAEQEEQRAAERALELRRAEEARRQEADARRRAEAEERRTAELERQQSLREEQARRLEESLADRDRAWEGPLDALCQRVDSLERRLMSQVAQEHQQLRQLIAETAGRSPSPSTSQRSKSAATATKICQAPEAGSEIGPPAPVSPHYAAPAAAPYYEPPGGLASPSSPWPGPRHHPWHAVPAGASAAELDYWVRFVQRWEAQGRGEFEDI